MAEQKRSLTESERDEIVRLARDIVGDVSETQRARLKRHVERWMRRGEFRSRLAYVRVDPLVVERMCRLIEEPGPDEH